MPAESTGQKTVTLTTSAGNNFISSSGGRFNAVLFCGAGAANAITVWDSATIHASPATQIGYFASSTSIGTFQAYDIPVFNGINVYDAAGGSLITVVYSVS